MRVRNTTWVDYQISRARVKELLQYCRDTKNLSIVEKAIRETNPSISELLRMNLVQRLSYDKIMIKAYIPIGEKDFYGYRRKALATLNRLLLEGPEV